MAEWRLLRALAFPADLRIVCWRQLINNLLAGVPKWRPFISRSAALFGGCIPSGFVPGDVAAGRNWRIRRDGGGKGLDCFSVCFLRVSVVKVEGLFVISYLLEVLFVKCVATAEI
jgi:hypothetical protein